MKLIITAETQAQAINEYIKKYYQLDIKVYAEEFDDMDLELQKLNLVKDNK